MRSKRNSPPTGIPHCVALSSGTSATHLALRHLGLGPGDEVLASTLTFIGSVTPVTFERATPVFIDCDESSWNMDPALLEQALEDAARRGKLPKAVIPTDLYGQSCDLPRIKALCDRHGVPVLCDSAESVGARYQGRTPGPTPGRPYFPSMATRSSPRRAAGCWPRMTKALIDHARKLSQQARDPAPWYEHTEIGFNYRMSNILAAIGRGQLGRAGGARAPPPGDFRGLSAAAGGFAGDRLHAGARGIPEQPVADGGC
jgi:dTDP-4-amino-4,6-dideoxygalactose transaminase